MPADVKLRDFRPDDAPAVHRWFNTDEVTADLVGSRDEFTLEAAQGWVERAMDGSRDRKWAITIDGSDDAVGFVALFGLQRDVGPELAVLVGEPAAWGKGVARAAERQACIHAFREMGAHRIHAEIPETNVAAQKVVTSLGFRQEGLEKKAIIRDGEPIDNQIWGLLPEDFTGLSDDGEG
jgi:RimJ/RimL family protein N-acetyltransferase